MKKMMSLIKACMTDNMSLFRVKKKDKKKASAKGITILLCLIFAVAIWGNANSLLDSLAKQHNEQVLLTLIVIVTAVFILIEGIYKAGSLLFNCKDDDLLLSLPIKKSTVIFIRILKFYVFELLYGSLFFIPTLVAYVARVNVNSTFYIVSVLAIFLLPIIPIVASCIIGAVISAASAKFKSKNILQTIISMGILLLVLYFAVNVDGLMDTFSSNAKIVGDNISKIYYPAGAYTKLATSFNMGDLFIFIGVHILTLIVSVLVISKVYFKINSRLKMVKKSKGKKEYKIKVHNVRSALIRKEFKKFINTPVLMTNAVFGLILFIVLCVIVALKIDSLLVNLNAENFPMTAEQIIEYMPVILVALITFGSLTSLITSSMISLEGKSFINMKAIPVRPYTIIMCKVYMAVLVMIPFILIGDLIFFIRFKFDIIEILLILLASIVLPFVAELLGIIINLKYPEMNGDSDAEVVKQSSSSNVTTLIGLFLVMPTIILLFSLVLVGYNTYICLGTINVLFTLILLFLLKKVKNKGVEQFNEIDV